MTWIDPGLMLVDLGTVLAAALIAVAISAAVIIRRKSRTIGSFAADLVDVFLQVSSDYRRRASENKHSRDLRRAHREVRRTRKLRPSRTTAPSR